MSAPASVTETPRASPFRSSARELVSHTTGPPARILGATESSSRKTGRKSRAVRRKNLLLVIKSKESFSRLSRGCFESYPETLNAGNRARQKSEGRGARPCRPSSSSPDVARVDRARHHGVVRPADDGASVLEDGQLVAARPQAHEIFVDLDVAR